MYTYFSTESLSHLKFKNINEKRTVGTCGTRPPFPRFPLLPGHERVAALRVQGAEPRSAARPGVHVGAARGAQRAVGGRLEGPPRAQPDMGRKGGSKKEDGNSARSAVRFHKYDM